MKDFFPMFFFLAISGLVVGVFGVYELWQSIPDTEKYCKGVTNCMYVPQIPIMILISSVSILVIAVWVLYNKPCYSDEIEEAERKKRFSTKC